MLTSVGNTQLDTHPEGLSIAEAATYLHNTQQAQETDIHAVSRIRTHDPKNRDAAKTRP